HALPGKVSSGSIRARQRPRGCVDRVPGAVTRRRLGLSHRHDRTSYQTGLGRMKIRHDISIVHTTHPFVIARGGTSEHRLIRVCITDADGVEGWGEAAPNRFYGETADTALAALQRLAPIVEAGDPWAIEDVEAEMNRA